MYDYVIVGAGSAGCVLAARLSEDPDVSVLLVEAGPPDTKENIHVPAAFGSLLKTDVDWDYATAPEDGCNGRMMYLPRGKVLGGSLVDQRDGLHPRLRKPTTTAGATRATPAGATTTSFRTSSGARTTSAASPSTTAWAGRCRSARAARATRWRTPGSRRRCEAGLERTRTSTAPTRTASAATR